MDAETTAPLVLEGTAKALALELAALTGKPVAEAVAEALEARLAAERQAKSRALLEIGARAAAKLTPPFHSSDHDDLYGPDGLPA